MADMTNARLAEIRERAVRAACGKLKNDGWLFCRIDAPALLAEVERLRTAEESLTVENARLARELEAAKQDLHLFAQCVTCEHSYDGGMRCRIPVKDREHKGDYCVVWQWRGAPSPGEGERGEKG